MLFSLFLNCLHSLEVLFETINGMGPSKHHNPKSLSTKKAGKLTKNTYINTSRNALTAFPLRPYTWRQFVNANHSNSKSLCHKYKRTNDRCRTKSKANPTVAYIDFLVLFSRFQNIHYRCSLVSSTHNSAVV